MMPKSFKIALALLAVFGPVGGAAAQTDHVAAAIQAWRPAENGFLQLCNYAAPDRIPKGAPVADLIAAPLPAPAKVFDNLYFVGSHWTNAWAITTNKGIILLDAMDNASEAEHIIESGLRRLRLDPATIRYVIVSHGHNDHYGGATYLREKFGARIVMSAQDWALVARSRGEAAKPGHGEIPAQDMTAADGDRIALGGASVELYLTPGHTMGTLSSIFDVVDHGVRRKAILWGGTSFNFGPKHPEQLTAYLQTFDAAERRVRAENIQVLISNHPEFDRSIVKILAMQTRSTAKNPFVIGSSGVISALEVGRQCALATREAWAGSAQGAPAATLR
jgi:metallo-beta-lactamase class B